MVEVGKWNPSKGRPVLCGMPLYVPSEEQVNKFYMLFYTMVGGYASIVQTMVTDLFNYVKADKKLFRFEAKKRLKEAKDCADDLIEGFKYYMDAQGLYQIWLDTTDKLEEDLKPDIQKQYYALDNQFLKHKVAKHELYTRILLAEISAGMLKSAIKRFSDMMREQNGINTFNLAEQFSLPINGLHARTKSVMEALYPLAADNEVFAECPDKFNLGFEVIGIKILDYERANVAVENAVKMSGLNLTFDGSATEHPIDNSGTPWNDAQIRAIRMSYENTSNKEVAYILGRSTYEVRKKAKELGLKKSEKYLREIRINNLKKKQNENS